MGIQAKNLSTPHEMPSQLGMKMDLVRNVAESATLRAAGEVRLHLGGSYTPFVQRGRIALETSSILHRRKAKSTSSKVRIPTQAIPNLQQLQEGVVCKTY